MAGNIAQELVSPTGIECLTMVFFGPQPPRKKFLLYPRKPTFRERIRQSSGEDRTK